MELNTSAPARKVVSRSPIRSVRRLNLPGIFPQPIECESSLERDFVLRVALCPGVTQLQHQPFRLELPGGKRYTPDFLVTFRSGDRVVVEVKHSERMQRYAQVFAQARQLLSRTGIGFLVLTEAEIRYRAAHERAALVLRYRKLAVSPSAKERVLTCLRAHPHGLELAQLQRRCSVHRTDVLGLAAAKAVRVSRAIDLDDDSRFFLNSSTEAEHEVHLEDWFATS